MFKAGLYIHPIPLFEDQGGNKCEYVAPDIPALVISNMPVSTPTKPFLSPIIAPFNSAFPKLLIGTLAPAPANFIRGSYQPSPLVSPYSNQSTCSMGRG